MQGDARGGSVITFFKFLASAFEFFNKIAARFREVRIRRAIKSEITNEARDDVEEDRKKVNARLREKYGLPPSYDP